MRLRVSLIVLVLIWVSQSSYCQYPQKRIFRGDSVVILSITQADTINKLYKEYNDSIQLLSLMPGFDSMARSKLQNQSNESVKNVGAESTALVPLCGYRPGHFWLGFV